MDGAQPIEDEQLLAEVLEPPLRMIHHQACTGGTLISKCLAAMPNVCLLSEVEPFSPLPVEDSAPFFAPTDLLLQAMKGGVAISEESISRAFSYSLGLLIQDARLAGQRVLIREHSHSNYFVGDEVASTPTMRRLGSVDHRVLSIVTVRDPIDSYLSLCRRQWVHFMPDTFAEYCRRTLLFLQDHNGLPLYNYEDFVLAPDRVLQDMCSQLEIPYSDVFAENFGVVELTGDSGRSSATISPRPRREVSADQLDAMQSEANYKEVQQLRLCGISLDA